MEQASTITCTKFSCSLVHVISMEKAIFLSIKKHYGSYGNHNKILMSDWLSVPDNKN